MAHSNQLLVNFSDDTYPKDDYSDHQKDFSVEQSINVKDNITTSSVVTDAINENDNNLSNEVEQNDTTKMQSEANTQNTDDSRNDTQNSSTNELQADNERKAEEYNTFSNNNNICDNVHVVGGENEKNQPTKDNEDSPIEPLKKNDISVIMPKVTNANQEQLDIENTGPTDITNNQEKLENNNDNSQIIDSDRKDYNESVLSDENNNDITTLQVDIDRAYEDDLSDPSYDDANFEDNEKSKEEGRNAEPSIYINLMKDTNFMGRDSQLSFLELDGKLANSARSETRPQTTSTMHELPGGLRAKANTPASLYTPNDELEVSQEDKAMTSAR